MARYARIVSGAVSEIRNFGIAPDPNPAKGLDWRPFTPGNPPSVDVETEILQAPTYDVQSSAVVETITKRNLTAQELSDIKDARINSINGSTAILKVMLNIHNRVRVLEGQPTHTMAQFKAAIKALL